MTEQACKEYIKNKMYEIKALCDPLGDDVFDIDLNDVDFQLKRIRQALDDACLQLKNCEDF